METLRHLATRGIVRNSARSARGERGVILLIVLALLQLLTLIGITFAVYASRGGPGSAIERVEEDIQRAQADLTALLENPDDPCLQEPALATVYQALRESSAIVDGSEPTPETRRLHGLLNAAEAPFDRLVTLLRYGRSVDCP